MPKSRGFTLIELMVVITIIAILGTIGIVVFSSAQKNARDGKRRADIEAIAKALELHTGQCNGTYCNLDNTWFAGGIIPTDPFSGKNQCAKSGADFCGYCFSSVGAQPGSPTDWANHGCNTTGFTVGGGGYFDNLAQPNSPGGPSVYLPTWILCANTELPLNGKYYYCLSNQQ